jgi:hypothetical protein
MEMVKVRRGENAMKERKKNTGWQNDTKKLKKRDQVAVTRLRTGSFVGESIQNHRKKYIQLMVK